MSALYTSGHMWFTPLPTIIEPPPTFSVSQEQPHLSDPASHQDHVPADTDRTAFYRLSTIPEIDYDFSSSESDCDSDAESGEYNSMYSYGDDAPTLYDQDVHHINTLPLAKEITDCSSSIYSYEDSENGAASAPSIHHSLSSSSSSSALRHVSSYTPHARCERPHTPCTTTSSSSSVAPSSTSTSPSTTTTSSSSPSSPPTKHEEAVLIRPATTLAIRVSSLSLREAKEVNHHARSRASRKTRLLNKLSMIFLSAPGAGAGKGGEGEGDVDGGMERSRVEGQDVEEEEEMGRREGEGLVMPRWEMMGERGGEGGGKLR